MVAQCESMMAQNGYPTFGTINDCFVSLGYFLELGINSGINHQNSSESSRKDLTSFAKYCSNSRTIRWATGTPSMGQSSQYPMWFGRCVAFAYDLWRQPHSNEECEVRERPFVERLIESLPPAGTLSEEAWLPKFKCHNIVMTQVSYVLVLNLT